MLKFFLVAHLTYENHWGKWHSKIRTFGFFGTPYCRCHISSDWGENDDYEDDEDEDHGKMILLVHLKRKSEWTTQKICDNWHPGLRNSSHRKMKQKALILWHTSEFVIWQFAMRGEKMLRWLHLVDYAASHWRELMVASSECEHL